MRAGDVTKTKRLAGLDNRDHGLVIFSKDQRWGATKDVFPEGEMRETQHGWHGRRQHTQPQVCYETHMLVGDW
eukprot:1488480-Prorocentrum_lima.AAC.1